MSDPRIYHRVGPVAPEGRQIYDDMRRSILTQTSNFDTELSGLNTLLTGEITALNTTLSGEIILIESNINDIEIAATDLDTQVNALTITLNEVGTGTGFENLWMEQAIPPLPDPPEPGTTVTLSSVVVTPVVAEPFYLHLRGGLMVSSTRGVTEFFANIYEEIAGTPVTYTWLRNLYLGDENEVMPGTLGGSYPTPPGFDLASGWGAGNGGGFPIGMSTDVTVPNTATDERTFVLKIRSNTSPTSPQPDVYAWHTGSFNAFQWTVA